MIGLHARGAFAGIDFDVPSLSALLIPVVARIETDAVFTGADVVAAGIGDDSAFGDGLAFGDFLQGKTVAEIYGLAALWGDLNGEGEFGRAAIKGELLDRDVEIETGPVEEGETEARRDGFDFADEGVFWRRAFEDLADGLHGPRVRSDEKLGEQERDHACTYSDAIA